MTKKQKRNLIRIIISLALLIIARFIPVSGIWQLIVYAVPYLIIGYDILWSAIRNIIHGAVFDENFLMALATVGAMAIGDYAEGASVMVFYQIGELFQSYAVGKSRKSIASLMDIRPDYADVIRNGVTERVEPESVAVGEIIEVTPGEKIPLDGRVISGSTTVNTSALTGESLPTDINTGDPVISGTVNLTGVIRIEVTKPYGESTVSRILDLVENSASKKAKTENFITRFARIYTPCVVIAAVLLAVIPPLFTHEWAECFHRALIFLVVSCPCALVISVPMSFFGGIGGASRNGILIKGSNYLEALSKTDTVVFDKTGTVTEGTFKVTAIHPEKVTSELLLEYAAKTESFSGHPIALSIKEAYGREIDKNAATSVEELAGKGIKAVIDEKTVYVGNGKLMDSIDVSWHECHLAGTVVHIAIDGVYMGHIVISDKIKDDAPDALRSLRSLGVKKTVMLTGDLKSVAESVAKEIGVDEVHAQLLPENKVIEVEKLLKEHEGSKGVLAFVGDGINDAPVLTRADIGIAMGAMGSDAAIEAADIVLMDDKPSKIALAIKTARKTMLIVKENIIFALAVKAVVLILSAFGISTSMWLAVFADVGVSVIAIINAMRALSVGNK